MSVDRGSEYSTERGLNNRIQGVISKFEYRNAKQIQNPKYSKGENKRTEPDINNRLIYDNTGKLMTVLDFCHLSLFRASCFGFRV